MEHPSLEDVVPASRHPSLLGSLVLYIPMIASNFAPRMHAHNVESFGTHPFGLPVTLVVCLIETILFIPIPWIFHHALRIDDQADWECRYFKAFYIFTVGFHHPHLRKSQFICIAGYFYFLFLFLAAAKVGFIR